MEKDQFVMKTIFLHFEIQNHFMNSRRQFIGKSSLGLFSFLSVPLLAFPNAQSGFEGLVVND
jgi:hypothetical protein